MTGTGWTSLTPASGASTTWGSNKVTLAIPAATTVYGASGIERSNFLYDTTNADLCTRIDYVVGDGESSADLVVIMGSSITNCAVWVMHGNGQTYFGYIQGGVFTVAASAIASSISSGDRTGGQLWLRMSRSPVGIGLFYGVGSSGDLPTVWNCIRTITDTNSIGMSMGRYAQIGINASSGLAAGFNLEVLAIRTNAAGGPL